MANTTDYSRLLDGYALLAIKDYIKNNYAAKSHTHTKSQITDFPSSMPANGGTSDYTNYLNITSTRLGNGSNKLQFMQYSGATDNPSNDWYSHIVMHHANNNGYYTEIATHFHGDNVYFRRKTNGTVGEWKRLAFTGESQPASDVYAWAKAATKPSYTYSEVGAAASNHNHDSVYLGINATAADSSKLNGQAASYYLNYNNFTNTPTIPTESTVSGWGFTKNIGTVTQVKIGTTPYNPTSGVISLPAYPTTLPASDVYSWAKQANKPTYTASEVGALASDAKVVLYTSQSLTTLQKSTARSNIGAGTSSLALGNTATTAAAGNHTHTLSIASGGTSSINLQANTTYTLTAGGKTYAFKTPSSSGGYYSNQYNKTYYLSSNSGASIWTEDIQAGNALAGFWGGNASILSIGWSGLASGSFKRSLLFTGNRVDLTLADSDQNYLKGLSIDMYDDDYYTLHIRANDYSDLYGSVDTENRANVNLHAYSFVYTPYSTNSAVSYKNYVDLGVVMHNINYTYSSTVLLKMNIRGTGANDGAITSYANLCNLLYQSGHRSAATCLTCSGRYSSYSYIVLGVYATSYNSGLYMVYCSASSNTVNTLSIPSGTVTDTLSASLVP